MEIIKFNSLKRFKTLKRTLSLNARKGENILDTLEETSKKCNNEFSFVNFENLTEEDEGSVTCQIDDHLTLTTNILPVQSKRGVLWQMSGNNIFSTWQERFCVLTENSFYSFSKKSGSAAKTFTKIKLSEISDIFLSVDKGQTTFTIKMTKGGKLLFRKAEGLECWYQQILANLRANRRVQLQKSMSLINVPRRPLMGISSLSKL